MVALDNSPRSVLTIHHFVFNTIRFERFNFRQNEGKSNVNFSVSVEKVEANHYTVTLQVDFEKVDEYMASVSISGYCEISDDTANLKELLRVNAPAILFPYARAQLSMLTAQPETEPIVLPVVDFQRMYEQSQKKGNI